MFGYETSDFLIVECILIMSKKSYDAVSLLKLFTASVLWWIYCVYRCIQACAIVIFPINVHKFMC